MKIAHISLGPTCVPAEILKASSLRTCTFGFDWFRSGSFFVEEFLNIPLPCFLDKYVTNPCIPLRQMLPTVLESGNLHTIEPRAIKPLYGYNYLYNPHRVLDDPDTLSYYKRSFDRLQQVINDTSTIKRYLVADYANKEYACHLDKESEIISWFKRLSRLHGLSGELYIIRILLSPSKLYRVEKIKNSDYSDMSIYTCTVSYWEELDREESRSCVYQKLGRNIFGAVNKAILWRPCSV